MGCCCPKEKNETDADERTRLLEGSQENQNQAHGSAHQHQKSRFLDQPGLASASHHHLGPNGASTAGGGGGGLASQMNGGSHLLNDSNLLNDSHMGAAANGQLDGGAGGMMSHGSDGADGENATGLPNHMFEKILSEVIHVSAYGDRGVNGGYSNDGDFLNNAPVQDMPFKFKEPQFDQQQQLTLPEGVSVPLTVLAAQPPFANDIRLINILAAEASNCINNFSLNVPENVAFDFKPVA